MKATAVIKTRSIQCLTLCLFLGISLWCPANTLTQEEPDNTALAEPQFFQDAHFISQLFTGSLATIIAISLVCILCWVASNWQSRSQDVTQTTTTSLYLNVIKRLWPDAWITLAGLLPYILFHFYAKWFLSLGSLYLAVRCILQLLKERLYLKALTSPCQKWSVAEEIAIDTNLKEKAKQERLALEVEEKASIAKAKSQIKGRIRIHLPTKPPGSSTVNHTTTKSNKIHE
jgi:hypothetical protein